MIYKDGTYGTAVDQIFGHINILFIFTIIVPLLVGSATLATTRDLTYAYMMLGLSIFLFGSIGTIIAIILVVNRNEGPA